MRTRAAIALAMVMALIGSVFAMLPVAAEEDPPVILVWGGSYGFRHPSITQGELAFTQLGAETGKFTAIVTENPADLNATLLQQVDAIAWISTTGKPPFTQQQRDDIIRFAGCGGGTLAFHAAADSNYGWAQYAELLGAQFDSHPKGAGSGEARMIIERPDHPILSGWKGARSFMLDDEYYRWRASQGLPGVSLPRNLPGVNVLLSLDETTVGGGIQKGVTPYEHHQPIAWTKTFRGRGRVYYNNMGHSDSTWSEPEFRTSLVKGVDWVAQKRLDAACFTGDKPLPPAPKPPAPRVSTIGDPCAIPSYAERTGPTWQVSGGVRRLTPAGHEMVMPTAGLPGGLGWGAQFYRLDLSTSKARTANVVFELSIPNPIDDYDLSVTTGWGWYGSQQIQGATTERVVLRNVPHCAILQVYADNLYAVSQQPASLTAKVVKTVQGGSGGGSTPELPDAPGGAAGVVAAPPQATVVGFAPPTIAVTKGSSVTFVNADSTTHDVTSLAKRDGKPLFNADYTNGQDSAEINGVGALPAGTYPFLCSLHTNMRGELRVL